MSRTKNYPGREAQNRAGTQQAANRKASGSLAVSFFYFVHEVGILSVFQPQLAGRYSEPLAHVDTGLAQVRERAVAHHHVATAQCAATPTPTAY
jgi:hypothetical protein